MRRVPLRHWVLWLSALVAITALMLPIRTRLDKAHVALGYLLVVLGGSSAAGRALGITLAGLTFLSFNFFFLPPYSAFVIGDPLDWLVLFTFLVTGIVAAQLLENQRREARIARERAEEIQRLAAVAEEAEALRRADRLKDALLASVSHDLRTPLTAIKGIANEIWRGGDPERAMTIEQEADRLNGLVTDLLDLSLINAGTLPLAIALNTADEVVGVAVERVEALHGSGRVDALVENEGDILVGSFDVAHTARALTNLVENAVKYSPQGSPVLLRATRRGGQLRFTVEDRGPGVAPGDEARIFEPFYRGARIVDGARGTGLGLSIARQLAEAQHGSLRYEPREGGGSRFVLELPGADAFSSESGRTLL